MTEADVRASGKAALMATRPMTRVNRAVEKGESLGFMKVLVDAETKMILGASLLGVGCDEAIHCLLDVMYAKAPYTTISRAVHIHPTVSELIPTLLQSLKPLERCREFNCGCVGRSWAAGFGARTGGAAVGRDRGGRRA
jgi:hypothetical protein